jgi:hypothetical protein
LNGRTCSVTVFPSRSTADCCDGEGSLEPLWSALRRANVLLLAAGFGKTSEKWTPGVFVGCSRGGRAGPAGRPPGRG